MRKKMTAFLCFLLLLGTASVYGAAHVNVFLNGLQLDGVTAEQSGDEVLVPIEKVADELGIFTSYNEIDGTLEISKPNVNVVLYDKELQTFVNKVKKGVNLTLSAFAIIDKAPLVEDLQLKFIIEDPDGNVVKESKTETWSTKKSENLFKMIADMQVHFTVTGEYKVKLQMEDPNEDGSFVTVGQASVYVK